MAAFNAGIISQGQIMPKTFDELRAQFEQAKIQKQQMAMNQQAIAEGQQGMQIKALQLEQAKKADAQQTEALGYLQKNAGDVDKTIADLVKSGNPQAFVFQKNKEAIAEQAAKTQEVQQKIADSKQKQEAENASHVANLTQGITDLPPELQGLQYKTNRAIAIQHGYAKPEDLPEEWNPQTAQIVQGLGQNAVSVKDQIEAKQKAAQQKEVQRHNVTGESLTAARDLNTAQHEAATLAETQNYHGIEAKQRQQQIGIEGLNAQTSQKRLGIEAARLGLSQKEFQQKYGDAAAGLSGANLTIAKQLSEGDFDPKQLGRFGGKEAIMAGAIEMAAKNGVNWTPQIYEAKKAIKTGKDGELLGSAAAAVEHLQTFKEASGKLSTLESLGSGFGARGTDHLNALAVARHNLVGEAGKLITGGVVGQHEFETIDKDLSSSRDSVRKAAADKLQELMAAKIKDRIVQKYENSTGTPFNPNWVNPTAREKLQQIGALPAESQPSGAAASVSPKGSNAAQPPAHIQSLREKYKY